MTEDKELLVFREIPSPKISELERISGRIARADSGCWTWLGYKDPHGYGSAAIGGKMYRAHRILYTLVKGKIPDGLHLDHLCRNPSCVNPDHLEPVTAKENTARGTWHDGVMAMHQARTHCKNGHEFTPENTIWRYKPSSGNQTRHCRTCCNEWSKKYYYQKKARKAEGLKVEQ